MSVEKSKNKKVTKLVVEAIQNLKTERGFTPKEIINFISANHGITERMVQCVYTALKRGTEYGILQKDMGRYALKMGYSVPSLMTIKLKEDERVEGMDDGRDHEKDACGRRRKRRSRSRRRHHSSRCGGHRKRRHRSRRRRSSRCGRKRMSRRRRSSRKRRSSCKKRGSRRRRSSRKRHSSRRKCGGRRHRSRRHRSRRSRRRRAKCRC